LSDLLELDSQASSSDEEDDERTISTVATDADTIATDADASSIYDMLHDNPEFDSLRLNSVVISRVPDEVIMIDNLEEGEWTEDEHPRVEDLENSNWIDSNCESIRSSGWGIASIHHE